MQNSKGEKVLDLGGFDGDGQCDCDLGYSVLVFETYIPSQKIISGLAKPHLHHS